MLKEIMARIAGIVVIIIIAIIVNFVLKRIPNDSNIKRFIRKWGRIITNVATTVITILTFIFPWISSPIFDEDTEGKHKHADNDKRVYDCFVRFIRTG